MDLFMMPIQLDVLTPRELLPLTPKLGHRATTISDATCWLEDILALDIKFEKETVFTWRIIPS